MQPGHRERKKQQQRDAIIANARTLFLQRGYQATSVADIAKAANCAPRTFFQYFSSKEDLLLIEVDALWDSLRKALEQRPTGHTALQTMQTWMTEVTQQFESGETFLPNLEDDTSLSYLSAKARQELHSMNELGTILLPEIAKDLKVSIDALEPKLAAIAAAALFNALHSDELLTTIDKETYIASSVRFLERALVIPAEDVSLRVKHERATID